MDIKEPEISEKNNSLTAEQQKQLDDLLDKFKEIFSNVPGKTKVLKMEINIGNSSPTNQNPYRISI